MYRCQWLLQSSRLRFVAFDVHGRSDVVFAGDHVLLESQDFACVFNPKQITIRTRASEKESFDSAPVTLTPELLAEIRYRVRYVVDTDSKFRFVRLSPCQL